MDRPPVSRSYQPVRLAKDQPILRRKPRTKPVRPADIERLQSDFWRHFDLEKFASDWRRGVGGRVAS
jgi:hypothetical protein